MRLSFVIPAYNEESYLPACLVSVLEQTREMGDAVEIVVVNNASSDRTREVALGFAGVRVVDEPRKGLPYAREAGFRASTGALVANVDADSRLTAGWVERVLREFEGDGELVSLSGPLVYYDLTARQRVLVQVFYATAWVSYAVNRWVLRVGSMVQGGNFVVRREALEAIGGFDTAIAFYGEDTDIARRMSRMGKVRFTFALRMFSSARRLKEEGMFTVAGRYSINYLWTMFRKRPFTEEYLDVREQMEG